ncbi:MAG: hypothetical protein ACREHC_05550 [Candidatus Levyibacteriota bacterium]
MKWIGITGTWRVTNHKVQTDVREAVRKILSDKSGIVTGGALHVDYYATDKALKLNPKADKIKVFLPTTLPIYARHYRRRATEGVITKTQAEQLIHKLEKLQGANPDALRENPLNTIVDKTNYYQRNQAVVDASDEIYAFQVNKSAGVQDTIDKAKARNLPVKLFTYMLD